MNHQYSGRDARPEKVAYFRKQVFMASWNVIGFRRFQRGWDGSDSDTGEIGFDSGMHTAGRFMTDDPGFAVTRIDAAADLKGRALH